MNSVTLSEFVSRVSCRFIHESESEVKEVFNQTEFTNKDVIDEITNDSDLFNLYGTLYLYRNYLFLFNGSVVQNVLKNCLEFLHRSVYASQKDMLYASVTKDKSQVYISNNHNVQVPYEMGLDAIDNYLNDLHDSNIIEDYFFDYDKLMSKVKRLENKHFRGYKIEISLVTHMLEASRLRAELTRDGYLEHPSLFHNGNTSKKECIMHALFDDSLSSSTVGGHIVSSNILIAFDKDAIKNHTNEKLSNIIFINMSSNSLCFASWPMFRQWCKNNSDDIEDILYNIKNSNLSGIRFEDDHRMLMFRAIRNILIDHINGIIIGTELDEVEQNKNRVKLYKDGFSVLESQIK